MEAKPCIVIREEHFSEIYHWCCCVAAPIFDLRGCMIGCLDITVSFDDVSKMSLLSGMAQLVARSIQSEIKTRQAVQEAEQIRGVLDHTVNLAQRAVVVIDKHGTINTANNDAALLFNKTAGALVGTHCSTFLKTGNIIEKIKKGGNFSDTIRLSGMLSGEKELWVEFRPLQDSAQRPTRGLLVFEDRKPRVSVRTNPKRLACFTFENLIGSSPGMERAVKLARRFAPLDVPILLQGETGSGKELFAHAVHNESPRKNAPFIPLNCAALPRDLVESELFGYAKGAFTGALPQGKQGKFDLADGGTLFLDEIDSMPLDIQGKLLRAIDGGEIAPVGANSYKRADVRIIVSSGKQLFQETVTGGFRKDLYYRISAVTILIPPLRERKTDIEELVTYFVLKAATTLGKPVRRVDPRALDLILAYDWPGNVRQLESSIVFAVQLTDSDTIFPEHLPDAVADAKTERNSSLPGDSQSARLDSFHLTHAIDQAGGKIGVAAQQLGVSRSTLYRRRRAKGLVKERGGKAAPGEQEDTK